jgi:hypothetical protein
MRMASKGGCGGKVVVNVVGRKGGKEECSGDDASTSRLGLVLRGGVGVGRVGRGGRSKSFKGRSGALCEITRGETGIGGRGGL